LLISLLHLVNILMLLAGPYGYIGQFAATICALRETLGEAEVFDRPSELRKSERPECTESAGVAAGKVVH
jgi:hypothetical protein